MGAKTKNEKRQSSYEPIEPVKKKGKTVNEIDTLLGRLEDSYVPRQVLFRDDEINKIREHIVKSLKDQGSQQAMYITGMPGLGKTMCLLQVVKELTQLHVSSLSYTYINCLKLSSPNHFFNHFWKFLSDDTVASSKTCSSIIENLFKNGPTKQQMSNKSNSQNLKKVKILIIDEVDFLMTRSQSVLYNIFDWQHLPYSKLIIITVANTLDFPERVQQKIQSRMGTNSLIFKPYAPKSIEQILTQRTENSTIFDSSALLYLSCKVASFSSDIRKALHLARLCLKEVIDTNLKIDMKSIDKVIQREFQKPLVNWVKGASQGMKIILVSLIYEVMSSNNKSIDLSVLYRRTNSTLKQVNLTPLDNVLYKSALQRLAQTGIFSLIENEKERSKVLLTCETEDLLFGLQDDKFLKEHNQLTFFLNNQLNQQIYYFFGLSPDISESHLVSTMSKLVVQSVKLSLKYYNKVLTSL